MSLGRRCTAEFFGTFWLVIGGCGSAVLDAAFPHLGIGFAGVALAFGLTLLTPRQVNRHHVMRQTLQIERDAHPECRRGTEIAVERAHSNVVL